MARGPPSESTSDTKIEISLFTATRPRRRQVVIGVQSSSHRDVECFLGIPYAQVHRRWDHSLLRTQLPCDRFDATRRGARCPQPSEPNTTVPYQAHLAFPDVVESEFECLNLQIHRPSRSSLVSAGLDPEAPLPVYIYIHGGAFAFGAATDPIWDPTRLVVSSIRTKQPFIAINVNYRLNIFGFLASDEISAAATTGKGCNFGLVDQQRAIEWVTQNIAAFGGNPSAITLGGQSAGGTSVFYHTLSALQTDAPLFRASIIQSPANGILGPLSMTHANAQYQEMCDMLQLSSLSRNDRLKRLRSLGVDDLLACAEHLGWRKFSLVIDGFTLPPAPCTADQSRVITRKQFPVLAGLTELEASIFCDEVTKVQTSAQFDEILTRHLQPPHRQQLQKIYSFDKESNSSAQISHDALYLMLTDGLFGLPFQQACDQLTRMGANVSKYHVQTGNPFPGPFQGKANHCVDLIYLYDCFHEALNQQDGRAKQECGSHCQTSHRTLVDIFQANIIDFIASGRTPFAAKNDSEVVYRANLTTDFSSVQADSALRDRYARYHTMEGFWAEARSVFDALLVV